MSVHVPHRRRLTLIERDAEIAAVHAVVSGARTGRPGAIIVEGPPGIGKTALVEHVIASQPRAENRAAWVSGTELHQRVAFGAVAALLGPLVSAHAASGPGAETELFVGAAELARPIFDGAAVAEPGELFSRLHGLFWLTVRLAEAGPLVLWLDDAHWLDGPSAAFVAHLVGQLGDLPVSVVVSRRADHPPGPADAALAQVAASGAAIVTPAPLSADGVRALIGLYRGESSVDAADAHRCHAISGGVPLYVEAIEHATGAATGSANGSHEVGHLALHRLHALGRAELALAEALAVRQVATLEEVAELVDVPGVAAEAAQARLAATGLVVGGPGQSLEFSHPVVRHAVYDAMDDHRRALLHRAAAAQCSRAGQRDAAASHLLVCGPAAFDGAEMDLLLLAARRAHGVGATDEAVAMLRRALATAESASDVAAAHGDLGVILAGRRDPEGLEHLARAHEVAPQGPQRAAMALRRGHALFWNARFEEASTVCREAARDEPDGELALLLEAEAISAELLRGVERSRPSSMEAAVSQGRTPGERAVLVHVAGDLAARGARPAVEVARIARRAIDDGRILDHAGPESPMLPFAVTTLVWSEDFDAALELVAQGDALARRRGSRIGVAYAAALRAGVRLRLGDLVGCALDARLVLDEYPAQDPLATMSALAFLLEALVDQGELDEARATVDRLGLAGELPVLGTVDYLLMARAWVDVCGGRPVDGRRDLEEVAARATRAEYPNPAGLAWRSRLALVVVGSEPERARWLAADEVHRAAAFGAPRAHGIALRAAALVGPAADRVAGLERAAAVLTTSRARLEVARVRIDLGEALHHAGRDDEAQASLWEGMTLAHECGAHGEAERAAAALRKTGVRPRRRAVRGIDSLTVHELACAELAVAGLTNRAIAERQFVTLRTVEQHLSKAYRKLGVAGRAALPGALAEHPRPH